MFNQRSFYIQGIRFTIKRVPNTKRLWYWKASKVLSGRAFQTYAAARRAAESYLVKFGDVPL
jgi:hypothetical protein